jgi:arylsulfatase
MVKYLTFFTPALLFGVPGESEQPNIIIILADDMGFSDIGCFGSEIETPNLDQLAQEGLRFSQFYNTGRSCPSRASLLTGMYAHKTGVGAMMHDYNLPAYRGHLNDSCLTIAQVLADNGYRSYAAGKWHVGENFENWPLQRGFERFYGSVTANGHYFGLRKGREMISGNTAIEPEGDWIKVNKLEYKTFSRPDGKTWYSTDIFTDSIMQYISDHLSTTPDRPFFTYLAYTAPHWPIHALPDDIAKYKNTYTAGWDTLRENRYNKLLELGIIDSSTLLSARDDKVPAWDTVQNKQRWIGLMAAYAAMIDRMDQNLGRLFDMLEEKGIANNTMIIFLSDNGGCAEAIKLGDTEAPIGSPDSYWGYDKPWANFSNIPFRRFKKWNHEGGISSPFIIKYPAKVKEPGSITHQPAHITDLMATVLEASHTAYPGNGHLKPLDGISLLPVLAGKTRQGHEYIFWEHEGNKAVRHGNWKLVKEHRGEWELYNLADDHSETNDLSEKYPDKAAALKNKWLEWAEHCHVVEVDSLWKMR